MPPEGLRKALTPKFVFPDLQEAHYRDFYARTYWEVIKVAKEKCGWVGQLPELDDADIHAGDGIEMSAETAVIPMPASSFVAMMMDVEEWERSFMPMVYDTTYFDTATNSVPENLSRHVAIEQLVGVYTKFQLPTTTPFSCLRYMKVIKQGIYAIIDVSVNLSDPKRKAGVIIRENDENSEIIWLEAVNLDVNKRTEPMYSSIINSKLLFEPMHWISTLLWHLKRQQSAFSERKITVLRRAGDNLLNIGDAMKQFYKECVALDPDKNKFEVYSYGDYRLMKIKASIAQSKLDLLACICIDTFEVTDKPPLKVFEILVKKNVQLLLSSLPGPEESIEEVLKFDSVDGSNSITLHRKKMDELHYNYYLQEASRSDYLSSILARPMTEEEVECYIVSGTASNEDKVKLQSTAVSGFTILPNGPGGLNSNGALVTCIKQLNRHPGIDFRQYQNRVVNEINGINETELKEGRSLFSCLHLR